LYSSEFISNNNKDCLPVEADHPWTHVFSYVRMSLTLS